ncbi:protein of unknown function (plasmid) [Cupriavidus taiwanensis]|uniref:Uncharacterized protein n=1 Tax=Cupriavidus taiwanensis TaxID=164546 RepID=A0A375IUS4_9BURK|nr:protein of unknown function [Cupriavidus taiwanensis]
MTMGRPNCSQLIVWLSFRTDSHNFCDFADNYGDLVETETTST